MDFYTVIGVDSPRTAQWGPRYGKVHSFSDYPHAKSWRTTLANRHSGNKFRIVHTSVDLVTGDVFSEIVAVAEEDLQ